MNNLCLTGFPCSIKPLESKRISKDNDFVLQLKFNYAPNEITEVQCSDYVDKYKYEHTTSNIIILLNTFMLIPNNRVRLSTNITFMSTN